MKEQKLGVSKEAQSKRNCQNWGTYYKNWKNVGKNKCKLIKISVIWKKMGNPMPFERVIGPNQHNKENYGNLQHIAGSMKPKLWVPSENLSVWPAPLSKADS